MRSDDAFDAILSDMNMGDGSAIELYEWLSSHCPELAARLLVMSGGALNDDQKNFLGEMAGRVLNKPIVPSTLQNMLADLLGANDGA